MTLIGFLMFLAPAPVTAWARASGLSEPTDEQAAAMVAALWVSGAGFSVMMHGLLLGR